MQLKNWVKIVSLALVIAAAPQIAKASDCYADPIYDRDWHGKYKQAAFVRDRACVTGTSILETVAGGTVVAVVGETDGWYKVITPTGKVGWTGATLMTITSEPLTPTTPVVVAEPTTTNTPLNVDSYNDTSLIGRVRGQLLLQVEDKGRIWYVNPASDLRYEVTRENAMDLFRNHALGITNANLNMIPTTAETNNRNNLSLRQRVRGRVLLQVEDAGKTWYIIPGELRRVQVTSADLYDIFRSYSLGITNENLEKIPRGDITDSTVKSGDSNTSNSVVNMTNVGINAPAYWTYFSGDSYSIYYPNGWYQGKKLIYPSWTYISEEKDYIDNLNTSNYLSVDSYVLTYRSAGKCSATESDDTCLKKGGYYLDGYSIVESEKMNINGTIALRERLYAPRGTVVYGNRTTSENESIILYTYRQGTDLYRVQYFNASWQEDYGFDQFDQIAKTFKLK